MIVLVDNYDSFVHNLARYFRRLGQETIVVRNDRVTVDELSHMADAVVVSPGPCTPLQAGVSLEAVRRLAGSKPILGVCLGHQVIGAAWGARIVRAPEPRHGRTSLVDHDGTGLCAGIPSPIIACRYHSLVIDEATLPDELRVTARTADGVIMAVQHQAHQVYGVQFHPEAALTQHGYELIANFLRIAGLSAAGDAVDLADGELRSAPPTAFAPPAQPVTF